MLIVCIVCIVFWKTLVGQLVYIFFMPPVNFQNTTAKITKKITRMNK